MACGILGPTLFTPLLTLMAGSSMPGVPFLGRESMACVTTISEAGGGDVLLLDLGGGVAAVSACQGKGAGPADAVGAEVAARLLSGAGAPPSRAPPGPGRT